VILTATLNAALDLTYGVEALLPHRTHRVREVHAVAGGKGLNVGRVLLACGTEVVATGLVGGTTGSQIRADLATTGMHDAMVEIAGESRRTVTVYAEHDGDATVFNEPGPSVSADEWARFARRFADLVQDADAAVLCGSIPPGAPVTAYAQLVAAARGHGVPVVVDTSGDALVAAAKAGPDVVKPNAAEACEATRLDDPVRAAAQLHAAGARAVVCSLGPDGLLALTEHGCMRARPPARMRGNPTGAGDACVAALASGAAHRAEWTQTLPRAVALSAAAVAMPRAGQVDLELADRFQPSVTLEVTDAPGAHC
jgi:tagatose 6-phosphate kinase